MTVDSPEAGTHRTIYVFIVIKINHKGRFPYKSTFVELDIGRLRPFVSNIDDEMKRFQSMRFSSLIRTKNFVRYGLLCLIVCIISLYICTYHHDNVIQTIFDITENQAGKTDLERIEARLQSYQQRRRKQCGNFLYKKYLPKLNKIKENGTLFDSPTILFIPPLSGTLSHTIMISFLYIHNLFLTRHV